MPPTSRSSTTTEEAIWLSLQASYDLEEARRTIGGALARMQPITA